MGVETMGLLLVLVELCPPGLRWQSPRGPDRSKIVTFRTRLVLSPVTDMFKRLEVPESLSSRTVFCKLIKMSCSIRILLPVMRHFSPMPTLLPVSTLGPGLGDI